jgi:hypothetical protein
MTSKEYGNGRDIPDENPVTIRKPLIRSVPDISAQEPQSSAVMKLANGMIQIVHRVDHMDTDLVSLGSSMMKGFANIESKIEQKFEEKFAYLTGQVDVLSGVSNAHDLPPMRRREDSQAAIENLSRHVSTNVREEAERIAKDPESTLDPETVTKLAEDAVNKVLVAQRERDRVKSLEAEKAERDRIESEKKEQDRRDADRNKDFRRNLTIAIVGGLIAGACAVYAAYMTGHENGHDKGVTDTLQAVPALTVPAVIATAVLSASAVPATTPATVAPTLKK